MAEGAKGIDAVFSRLVPLADFAGPISGRIDATPQERFQLAALFKIQSLDSFSFDYTLTPAVLDRAELTGAIRAELTQLCILTLEPVSERVDETVSVECRPQEQIGAEDASAGDADPLGLPDDPPAPIVNGRVDVGAVAAEILATAINPYPRRNDAEFGWQDPRETDGRPSGPFAELAKLKPKL
jgi:hypothetical protein